MTKLKGRITISRYSDDTIHIRMQDDLSGTEFVEAELSLEDFAKAITNQGYIPMEFEWHPQRVGARGENKTEIVSYLKLDDNRKHDPAALAKLEVNGWVARQSDLTNHHRWRDTGIEVVFFRHVNIETGEPL